MSLSRAGSRTSEEFAACPTAAPTPSAASSSGTTATGSCPTSAPPPMAAGQTASVTIETTRGTIVLKVEGDLAPNAAGNFVALAACGYYDNVVFHRLVPGFVIQGGDGEFGQAPTVDTGRVGTGGPGYRFEDQPVKGTYKRGTLAMATASQTAN